MNILRVDPERALRLCKRLLHLLPSLFQLIIVIMITIIIIIMMMIIIMMKIMMKIVNVDLSKINLVGEIQIRLKLRLNLSSPVCLEEFRVFKQIKIDRRDF